MELLVRLLSLALAALSLRGPSWPYARWAFAGYVVLSLLYFPLRADFVFASRPCALAIDPGLAILSLRNYAHIVLFAGFFLLSRRQFSGPNASLWAGLTTVAMGALVEAAQGLTGEGNCRLRDLIPDGVGALVGVLLFGGATFLWRRWSSRTSSRAA